jgi:hypothetical protein
MALDGRTFYFISAATIRPLLDVVLIKKIKGTKGRNGVREEHTK